MDSDSFDRLMLESIAEEIKARDFYKEAASRMKERGIQEVFEQLSRDEEGHRIKLETFRFDPLAKVEFEKVQDYGVAESQADVPLGFDMSPRDAFQIAMKKEQKAMELYSKLASRCSDSQKRAVYLELAEMERGHKARIEELWSNAAFPETW